MEAESGPPEDENGIRRGKRDTRSHNRQQHGKIGVRHPLMVQDLADLAAVFVVRRLRRRRGILDHNRGQMPGDREIVMMPPEQKSLK